MFCDLLYYILQFFPYNVLLAKFRIIIYEIGLFLQLFYELQRLIIFFYVFALLPEFAIVYTPLL